MDELKGIKHNQILQYADGRRLSQECPTIFGMHRGGICVRLETIAPDGTKLRLDYKVDDDTLQTGVDENGDAHYYEVTK